ncbi:MAG: AMP-binding protein [Roseiflexaceae bacterium]|nr:AMP-binding protein [Roseiflexaceae bacterium]
MASSLLKRLPNQQALYNRSPRALQRLFVNAEAWRRDWFRRYGDYDAELKRFDPSWYTTDLATQEAYQIEQLQLVIDAARSDVDWYHRNLPPITIHSLAELGNLPILEKDTIRANRQAFVQDGVPTKALWLHSTSGSTGAPLHYYHDRSATRAHQAVADAILNAYGCRVGDRRVRISGVYVAPYEQKTPPFWIYIDHYRQLQCSAYHLAPGTYSAYLQAMRDTRVTYGTGYASAWHLLAAHILESGEKPPQFKAIFTDSEGISLDQQATVERAFGCPVYQTYGTGEVAQVAQQCINKRYHILTRNAIIEIVDDDGHPVRPGETGQVIVTDLISFVTPFIRYRTGDLATLAADSCSCGWQSPALTTIVGRLDDRIRTPEGRWVRVGGHIIRPALGVKESQIVQIAIDHVIVRVVPGPHFEPASMDTVMAAARQYIGDSVRVTWEQVDSLPRTRSGKLRHVVREIA